MNRKPKRCPHCDGDLRNHFTVSVSAEAYAWMKPGAESLGMSLRQLVDEATQDLTISNFASDEHDAFMLGGTTTTLSPARENGVAAKLVGREQGNL